MICNSCKIDKPLDDFPKNKNKKNGVGPSCKECRRKYYSDNKKHISELVKLGYLRNKDRISTRNANYKKIRKDATEEYNKKYYEKNRDAIITKTYQNKKHRLEADPYFRMKCLLSSRIRNALNRYSMTGKTKSCAEYGVDFSAIYSRIGPRPSKKHHLDHIIPLTLFNLSNPEHVRLANIPNNLRWVKSEVNLKKNKSIQIDLISSDPILNEIYLMLVKTEDLPLRNKS